MTPNLNLWLIPVLPLIGAALNGLFGKRLPAISARISLFILISFRWSCFWL